ncbi:MAG: hypothetical protein B7Y41_15880, partial [Hydrogenophilales bacterium 28-61-23]
EEAAAAAESLQDQAAGLSQAVAVFKTQSGNGRLASPASARQKSAAPAAMASARSAVPAPVRAMQRMTPRSQAEAQDEWQEF